jgi:WD40 repeat protein
MCPRDLVFDLARGAIGIVLATAIAQAQETVRISDSSSGQQGDKDSGGPPSLSSDGQIVSFESDADNLVPGDTNQCTDIFVRDRTTGLTERVSVDSNGAQGNAGGGPDVAMSSDGMLVAFVSASSNLVPGDANGVKDVFVHDRATGLTERVSVDSSGVEGNADCWELSISADGNFVAFASDADNLVAGDTNQQEDVFIHDRSTGVTERVSVDSSGREGNDGSFGCSVSSNGRIVAFSSSASNLVTNDRNGFDDVFIHDRVNGRTARMSVRSDGKQGWVGGGSYVGAISENGQIVAFMSDLSDLVAGDTNGSWDVFVHDRNTGQTDRVSVASTGAEANVGVAPYNPAISPDGMLVAFTSRSNNLVAGDTNKIYDVFVHDRSTGMTRRVSVDSSGAQADGWSILPIFSADGNTISFMSKATNLSAGDTNRCGDVFVHHEPRATWSNYGTGFPGTNGIPAFTAQSIPALGTSLTLVLDNSFGAATSGLLFVGFQQTNLPTSWGGDLLVVPALVVPVTLASGSNTFTGSIPDDPALIGTTVDLQAFEADPGAAKGVSSTAGLELLLGY